MRRRAANPKEQERHVVVLGRAANERGNLAQHTLAKLGGRLMDMRFDNLAESGLAETVAASVHRLGDAVSEQDQEIAFVNVEGVLSRRFFSACSTSRPLMLAVVELKDAASSPS